MFKHALLMALAGGAGTLARAGVYAAAQRLPIGSLPLATLIVNVVGSCLFGVIWAMSEQGRLTLPARLVILGGFMGAFTTFSTFAFETGDMLRSGRYLAAGVNVLANNGLAIAAFLGGWALARNI